MKEQGKETTTKPLLNESKPRIELQHTVKGTFAEAATKYRKGACTNCGALSHKTKECMDRPRKVGAKWTGKDIKPDEFLQETPMDFSGKRDRWNGYNPSEYAEVIAEWESNEEKRAKLIPTNQNEEEDKDDEKYAETVDMPGQKVDLDAKTTRMTVRNLRLREDTAKYLRNLDPNSAYYDPKTRSMRENPFPESDPRSIPFAGDNYNLQSSQVEELKQLQQFAWVAAEERGVQVNVAATPSQTELLHKQFISKRSEEAKKFQKELIEKYGIVKEVVTELPIEGDELYREYSTDGSLISSISRFKEDVHPGNHTSCWGSYWKDFKWGYACCHSFIMSSYCTGEAGINAEQSVEAEMAERVKKMEK